MPRTLGRATRGLLYLAAVALLALPGAAGGGGFDPRAVVWSAEPILNGQVVASCGETSPLRNVCGTFIGGDACDQGCAPNLGHGPGFTGLVSSIVWGKGSRGDDRHVSWNCPYVAGSQANLPFAYRTGDCWGGSNAETFCPPAGGACGYIMWPPFRLEGRAGSWQGLGPTGAWNARVESG